VKAPKKLAAPVIPLLALLLTLAGVARADIPPPERAACEGKMVGAACDVNGRSGTCQDSTCSRTDQRTGETTTYACRKCVGTPDAGPGPREDDSGCTMAPGPRALGPWLLAGGFALLVLRFRRRR
jgi:hypothetical protein